MNATNLDYALISDEDLLSNIDRISRLAIPNTDIFSEEDGGSRQPTSNKKMDELSILR